MSGVVLLRFWLCTAVYLIVAVTVIGVLHLTDARARVIAPADTATCQSSE